MTDFDTKPTHTSYWASFFSPTAPCAAAHIRTVLARLLGTDGHAAASGGEVQHSRHFDARTGEAVIGGLVDPSIFGNDGKRPGVIVLPTPLIHPACRAELAQRTGLSESEVRAVGRFDTCLEQGRAVSSDRLEQSVVDRNVIFESGGAKALRALLTSRGLPDDGLIDHVPVIPPAQRPHSLTDAGVRLPGTIGYAFERFIEALQYSSTLQDSMLSSL